MTWVIFMSANDAAMASVLPSGRDRIEHGLPGEAPAELLARISGKSPLEFALSGAAILYGSGNGSLRTATGDPIKIRLAPSVGASSNRSNAGGNGIAIVIDRSLTAGGVLITRARLSGHEFLAIAGVNTYSSAAIRAIQRQELVTSINRSQQGFALGLTGE